MTLLAESMQFYAFEYWHVVHLQNHDSPRTYNHWWSRDQSFQSMNEWEARDYADKEYPDKPVRLVRALWVPEITSVERLTRPRTPGTVPPKRK